MFLFLRDSTQKEGFLVTILKKGSVFTQILFSDFYPLEAKSIVILYNIPQLLAVEVAVGAVACNNNYYKLHFVKKSNVFLKVLYYEYMFMIDTKVIYNL
jgi:hypothetical protein